MQQFACCMFIVSAALFFAAASCCLSLFQDSVSGQPWPWPHAPMPTTRPCLSLDENEWRQPLSACHACHMLAMPCHAAASCCCCPPAPCLPFLLPCMQQAWAQHATHVAMLAKTAAQPHMFALVGKALLPSPSLSQPCSCRKQKRFYCFIVLYLVCLFYLFCFVYFNYKLSQAHTNRHATEHYMFLFWGKISTFCMPWPWHAIAFEVYFYAIYAWHKATKMPAACHGTHTCSIHAISTYLCYTHERGNYRDRQAQHVLPFSSCHAHMAQQAPSFFCHQKAPCHHTYTCHHHWGMPFSASCHFFCFYARLKDMRAMESFVRYSSREGSKKQVKKFFKNQWNNLNMNIWIGII